MVNTQAVFIIFFFQDALAIIAR